MAQVKPNFPKPHLIDQSVSSSSSSTSLLLSPTPDQPIRSLKSAMSFRMIIQPDSTCNQCSKLASASI
ncbi:unnamed protein product [Brassica napus]|uniref:(rape) hypothetical protein n=1 Tax=Brassica napus TaxID=3708 RepID=A0A816ZFF1_BRANA|nr:unnamed protein product [Brassica napus]